MRYVNFIFYETVIKKFSQSINFQQWTSNNENWNLFIFQLICFMNATSILILCNSVAKHIHPWGGLQGLWLLEPAIQATQYTLSAASCFSVFLFVQTARVCKDCIWLNTGLHCISCAIYWLHITMDNIVIYRGYYTVARTWRLSSSGKNMPRVSAANGWNLFSTRR